MREVMLKKLKILVIDDDFEKKAPFRRILEKQGFSVTWCQDWNEVKHLFPQIMKKGSMPNIVLVDMNFFPPWNVLGENPAMEGVMIIKKFFQTCETYGIEPPPIIGFTSQADYMQKQEMIRAGVTDFITADEFKDRVVLGRRLLQCIQEALETRMLRPPSVQDIQQIEENIVQRALSLNNYSIGGTADFLNWPVEEIKVITHRLQEKGQCHVF